jgi:hypothetical protein
VLEYVISEVIAFPWDPGTVKERAYQARLAAFWEKAGPLLHQAAEAKERVSVRKAVDVVAGAIGRHVEPAVPAGQPRADVAPLVLLAEILSDDMVQCSIEGGAYGERHGRPPVVNRVLFKRESRSCRTY